MINPRSTHTLLIGVSILVQVCVEVPSTSADELDPFFVCFSAYLITKEIAYILNLSISSAVILK